MDKPSSGHPQDSFSDALRCLDADIDSGQQAQVLAALQALRQHPPSSPGNLIRLEARELRHKLSQDIDQAMVDQAFALVDRAEQLHEREHAPYPLADVLTCLARLQSKSHLSALALASLGRAETLYESLQDQEQLFRCLNLTAKILHDAEMYQEAVDRLEPWARDAERLARLSTEQRYSLLVNLAAAYSFLDRAAEATYWQEILYAEALTLEQPARLFRDAVNLANQRLWTGHLDEARRLLAVAEATHSAHPISKDQQTFLLQNKALIAWKAKQYSEAIALFHQARDNARAQSQWPILGRALRRRAECAEEAGFLEEALSARKEQLELTQSQLRAMRINNSNSMLGMLDHARTQAQNEYLRKHGNQLELELAERNRQLNASLLRLQGEIEVRRRAEADLQEARDALEIKVEERGRELEHAMRLLLEREKQLALGHLVAGVAHELNTPIGNALLATSTMSDSLHSHRQAFEENRLRRQDLTQLHKELALGLDIADRSLVKAADLVGRFKALAIEQSSAQVLDFKPQQVIDNTLAVMAPALRAQQVELECQELPTLTLRGDPGALGQVLAQLIENSLVHGFENSAAQRRLMISGAVDQQGYVLCVEDNGKGIEAEHLARVFDPFFTTRLGQGSSGLGLHMVYRLVTQSLKGQIRLHSAPGSGCRVELSLPLNAA
ncbi:sensor histidine kinase [Paucibacter sp. Y2R2-4]|uniref:sensor histidine kinase n=1 Tax=Paucibacter sp. Y2R2-4 TaxID=2893553 RepID=UPI0021E3CEFD|nr:HAMP domain-containing sensor histidine kinase [Paucibacter sp. Y2R2-4]MCV2349411.1 HAMP domain-containing histidine kinase [Paucibacter sp. Y2R2-4]